MKTYSRLARGFSIRVGRQIAFLGDLRGVTAVEYAIIAGVIVIAIVVSVPTIGHGLTNIFDKITPEL